MTSDTPPHPPIKRRMGGRHVIPFKHPKCVVFLFYSLRHFAGRTHASSFGCWTWISKNGTAAAVNERGHLHKEQGRYEHACGQHGHIADNIQKSQSPAVRWLTLFCVRQPSYLPSLWPPDLINHSQIIKLSNQQRPELHWLSLSTTVRTILRDADICLCPASNKTL